MAEWLGLWWGIAVLPALVVITFVAIAAGVQVLWRTRRGTSPSPTGRAEEPAKVQGLPPCTEAARALEGRSGASARTFLPVDYAQEQRMLALGSGPLGAELDHQGRPLVQAVLDDAVLSFGRYLRGLPAAPSRVGDSLSTAMVRQRIAELQAHEVQREAELRNSRFTQFQALYGGSVPEGSLQALVSERVAELMGDGRSRTARDISEALMPEGGFATEDAQQAYTAMVRHVLEVEGRFRPTYLNRHEEQWRLEAKPPEPVVRTRYERMLDDE